MRFRDTLGISALITDLQHTMILEIEGLMKPLDLSFAQYSVLSALEDQKLLTNADLARRCNVTPQTMTRIVQILLRRGLIKDQQDPSHALKIQFTLTPKAEKLICKAHVLVNHVEVHMTKVLNKNQLASFNDALQSCLKQCQSITSNP